MNINNAFLIRILKEEVLMKGLEGFVNPKYPNHVCSLQKAIYGLKQALRA